MKKRKRTILLIKIKAPDEPMKVIEAEKKDGWTDTDIRQFIKGVRSSYPDAVIRTSTISKRDL